MLSMQLPMLLPKQLTYCESAKEDEELYNLLLRSTPDLVLFLETACADETWVSRHSNFMSKAIAWFTLQFFQDRLDMDLARRASKAIRNHFHAINPYILLNLLLKLKDKDLQISSLLYGSSSETLRELIRRECRDMKKMLFKLPDVGSTPFIVIDQYVRTGETQEVIRKDREIVTQILEQAKRWDLKELSDVCEDFLKRYITRVNMVEMLLESHLKGWQRLRDACFEYISNLKIGLRFPSRERDRLAFEFLEFNDNSLALFDKVRQHVTDLICGQDLAEEEQFGKVVKMCPKMLCLDIGHSDGFTDQMKEIPRLLQELSIPASPWLDDEPLKALIQICPHVRKLVLTSDSKIGAEGWGDLQKLTKLRELDVTRCGQIGDQELALILEACSSLVSFFMEDCRGVSDKGFFEIPRLNTRLIHLNIARCNINDAALVELATKCRNLVYLNLTRCDRITERGIQVFISEASALRTLDLTHCNIPKGVIEELNRRRPYLKVMI
ncbi:MAG: hypothetical protein LLG04_03515 [Parachlamydia sp.]|nr:hypothetical protein [Parachlamydia sp.]